MGVFGDLNNNGNETKMILDYSTLHYTANET